MSTNTIIDKLKNDVVQRCKDRLIAASNTSSKIVEDRGILSKFKKNRGL